MASGVGGGQSNHRSAAQVGGPAQRDFGNPVSARAMRVSWSVRGLGEIAGQPATKVCARAALLSEAAAAGLFPALGMWTWPVPRWAREDPDRCPGVWTDQRRAPDQSSNHRTCQRLLPGHRRS